MKLLAPCILAGLLSLGAFQAAALLPRTMAYQGFLATSAGQPVNGTVQMTFNLYLVADGGVPLWSETQSVAVFSGSYTVRLGSVTPLELPFDQPYFLGVAVAPDGEMTPRQPLSSSPYALGRVPAGQISGVIPPASGGTGLESLPVNGVLFGQGAGAVGAAVGAAGQVLTSSGGAPQWSGSPSIGGNLLLAATSTEASGGIVKGTSRFLHAAGTTSVFLGENAGRFTPTGADLVGIGSGALSGVTTGASNTAVGANAMLANTTGSSNAAFGTGALRSNATGTGNTAIGAGALQSDVLSTGNTAVGFGAMRNAANFFGNNIAIGYEAGTNIDGFSNIVIGHAGNSGEFATIRIGDSAVHLSTFIAGIRGVTTATAAIPVLISTTGQLGTTSSSRRHKLDIADMGQASATLMKLRPVTFTYRAHGEHGARPLHYGLVAEEVAEVDATLVAHSADGRIETVMYHFLPPMLLNEYQKQQRMLDAQAREIRRQDEALERQSAEVAALRRETARLARLVRDLGHHSAHDRRNVGAVELRGHGDRPAAGDLRVPLRAAQGTQ